MGVLDAIGGIFSKAGDAADKLFTSDEERLAFRLELEKIKAELLTSQHALMTAEVQQDDKLTKRWRPIIGLGFFGLIALIYGKAVIFGGDPIPVPDPLFWLVSAVLGVQIAGRSWEKVKKNGA